MQKKKRWDAKGSGNGAGFALEIWLS